MTRVELVEWLRSPDNPFFAKSRESHLGTVFVSAWSIPWTISRSPTLRLTPACSMRLPGLH
jgi:hypothetical protein